MSACTRYHGQGVCSLATSNVGELLQTFRGSRLTCSCHAEDLGVTDVEHAQELTILVCQLLCLGTRVQQREVAKALRESVVPASWHLSPQL